MYLTSQSETLQTLLSGNKQYLVPNYQRNYSWQADQIDTFLNDIFENAKAGENHFFGPVVLLDNGNSKYELVDGQQRLTSVVILACLLRDKVATYANSDISINGTTVGLSFFVSQLLWCGDWVTPRFSTNYQISDVFDNYVLAHPDSENRKQLKPRGDGLSDAQKRATKELRAAYFRMKSRIDSWVADAGDDVDAQKEQIYKLIDTLLNSFELLAIAVTSLDDAYMLFETLNDRGLRLTPSDLIKSRTLQKIQFGPATISVDAALAKWDAAVEQIGEYPFTKFLRHYLLTEQTTPVQARRLFSIVTERIENLGTLGAERNLKSIAKAAELYAQLLNLQHGTGNDKLDRTLKRLNLISDTHRVFLLKVLAVGYSIEDTLQAARATECLAFRWVLTGGNAQVLENIYQNHAHMLVDGGNPQELKAVLESLLSHAPTDERIKQEILLAPASSALQAYVLRRINLAITHVDLPWEASKLNVEHLAPQRPHLESNWTKFVAPREASSPDGETYNDFVSKWGNLTLLEFEINKSIKNAEWRIKVDGVSQQIKGLKHSNIAMTHHLVDAEAWTADLINARTEWIAESITALTSPATVFGNDIVIPIFSLDPG